ncbi:MAG: ATP-binding protein [Pseudomonadota bacterium]
MRSLTLRIFLGFWLIIGIMIGLAGLGGYAYSERLREAFENFEISDTVVQASEVLATSGRDGLTRWLRQRPRNTPMNLFVVDPGGQDLLGRRLPRWAGRLMRRYEGPPRDWQRDDDRDRPNLRPARPLTQLRGPDGTIYTMFVEPRQNAYREWISERAGPAFLVVAVVLSGTVSWVLARVISSPVQRFREATVSIAEGRLDTRVAESMRNRRDEIGLLAHDLDAMAAQLEQTAHRQQELTRNASHELRSPLARLKVALELARRKAGDLQEFGRIDNEVTRLDDLIGQLLSFARVDAVTDGDQASLSLVELLREVVDDANYECRSSGLDDISVELQTDGQPAVRGVRTALQSAFENVIRNAIHHGTEHTAVEVRVAEDGDRAIVTIADRGPGVPENDLGKLFEPFYRAPDAMAKRADGSGLGLAIAWRAIQGAGGVIQARNREQGGLAIDIRLPLAAGPA